jgi:predicted dehydrogenase
MARMTPVRIVHVGLGTWGRDWAWRVNPRVPEVEVVGYVDSNAASLGLLGRRVRAAKSLGFASLDDAIPATAPEALLITTPLSTHERLVEAGIDAGLHVLVEKPFVPDLAIATRLVDAAATRHVKLMVSQNYRFFPAPREVQRLMAADNLGDLYAIDIDFRRYSRPRPDDPPRHHSDEQPLLVDMSVHHFDLLRMLLRGEPDSVAFEVANPRWSPFAGPAVAAASIRFGDVLVSYRGTWLSGGPITPWAGEWRMEFERGNVLWTSRGDNGALADRVVVRPRGAKPQRQLLPKMAVDRWGALTEFARAIRDDREPESSGRENLGTVAFMESAVRSASEPEALRR